ncbi:VOC family protein [Bacillus albus]|uniref:VOC family protein n=1 Tax=Bacillus albus TaxID=2026189 RepID=UPI003D197F84
MSFQLHPDTTLDVVHLYVSNIKKSLEFYTEVLSMKVLKQDEMVVTFGNENNEPLLIIEEKKEALPKQRGRTGLYHYAILLPSRQDLANILRHLVEMVYPLHGGADHYFSEALYLADPDGNGIEIYHDRQKEVWRNENGELPFVSNPLAGEELLQQGSAWNGFPAGTVMGHVHLHVADLEEAKRFYVDGLGFEVTIPARNGALFVSAGGYHHHVGLNTWQGEGIPPQMPNSVGLKYFTIVLADEKQKEQVCESLKSIGKIATYKDGILQVEDPFGHSIHFKIKGEA